MLTGGLAVVPLAAVLAVVVELLGNPGPPPGASQEDLRRRR